MTYLRAQTAYTHCHAALQKQPTGGALLSEVLLSSLRASNVPITPHYLVKTKEPVEPNQPARAALRCVQSTTSLDRQPC